MRTAVPASRDNAPFSKGVIVSGRLLYVSGQTATDADSGRIDAESFEDEARQTLIKLRSAVEACGGTLSAAVKLNVYLADLAADLATFNKIYSQFFSKPLPARTTVQAKPPGAATIEVEAIIALDLTNHDGD